MIKNATKKILKKNTRDGELWRIKWQDGKITFSITDRVFELREEDMNDFRKSACDLICLWESLKQRQVLYKK